MSADELGETLLKCLRGKKYLIVMDDIWDLAAWNDIQRSFPREHKESKVLFTSRQPVPPNGIHYNPHYLGLLSESFSWELLQNKVFKKEECPQELVDIGMNIATKCQGLPLAIVAIAGLLAAENKTLDVWKEVANNLSSTIAKEQEGTMEILELSYNHLPLHLKACFLYVGAHPEDFEIRVRDLMWLWIAEGFIHQSGRKSLEDIAYDYLNDLIERNLIMVAQKNWIGTIMKCSIHDLLCEFCLKKGKEEKVFMQNYGDELFSPFDEHRRIFIGPHLSEKYYTSPCGLSLRSFLCPKVPYEWSNDFRRRDEERESFPLSGQHFELLRVFHSKFSTLKGDIMEGDLVHLRYLALSLTRKDHTDISDIFGCLSNLEILNLYSLSSSMKLPENIFKMVKLRHLHCTPRRFTCPSFDEEDKGNVLYGLQTLHGLAYCEDCPNFLKRTPNLRQLELSYIPPSSEDSDDDDSEDSHVCICLEFLKCLEILHLQGMPGGFVTFELKLPPTITQLSLEITFFKWEDLIISLRTLPNLEVLVLGVCAVTGESWDTSEIGEGFPELKYLRLESLLVKEWRGSEDLFPKLEILEIQSCPCLTGIPIEFGNLYELREIRLHYFNQSVKESAMKIQEEQRNKKGDDACQIIWLSFNDDGGIDVDCYIDYYLTDLEDDQ